MIFDCTCTPCRSESEADLGPDEEGRQDRRHRRGRPEHRPRAARVRQPGGREARVRPLPRPHPAAQGVRPAVLEPRQGRLQQGVLQGHLLPNPGMWYYVDAMMTKTTDVLLSKDVF